jgi:hypothetical protein
MFQNGETILNFLFIMIEIILLPVITFFLGWLVQRYRQQQRFKAFCHVFGQVVENPENVIISLPLWKVKEASRDSTRFRKVGFDGLAEEYYGPDDTIAFDDLEASARIAAILAEFYPNPVNYVLDNDTDLNTIGKTVILLGSPNANTHTRQIIDQIKQPYLEFIDQTTDEKNVVNLAIKDKLNNQIYDSSGIWKYSLVLRLPNPLSPDASYFVVAGTHAIGTLAAATYMKNHWDEFQKAKSIAGVLLKMPRSDIAHHLVVKKFGFPS